ncbi:hypothetical protein OOK60_08735 [Trichothermofontia sichuanensis B231]|uniref:hypothetical protein n=1 Tax=Trichothermofontia sichuanensis TaxID=3045816 RepID=UPI0022451234|nr:hypothetical protein [Trichothermofontia sichuanensis]UZQ56122.1 hypothetical protein OOK60_08735 [Trichothermofontia sichuanensis B231]
MSLRLVFLGQPTLALPLGVWVVLAGLAGAGTTGVLIVLFHWSNHLARQATKRALRADRFGGPVPASPAPATASPTAPPRNAAGEPFQTPPRPSWPWSAAPSPSTPSPTGASPPTPAATAATAAAAQPPSHPTEVWDDWVVDDRDQDWEDTPPVPETTPPHSTPATAPSRPDGHREPLPDPRPSRPSSVYSYSSQQLRQPDGERFAAGRTARTEAIYDAEYRVIIPPYRDLEEDTTATDYASSDYPEPDDIDEEIDEIDDDYDELGMEIDENGEDALGDEDEEPGDEVFEDWEEDTESSDWPRH